MNEAFYEQVALWSQVLGAVAFLGIVVWGWFRFVTPAVIVARDQKNAELLEIERRRDAARADVEAARRELEDAGGEVVAIRARAERDAARLRERVVSDAALEGDRLVRNAEGELDRSRLAARDRLRDELLARALEIARDSAKKLGDETNRRLMNEVVSSLESASA
jgi:F0F1-type ATP synthase membrane subunit b/b'